MFQCVCVCAVYRYFCRFLFISSQFRILYRFAGCFLSRSVNVCRCHRLPLLLLLLFLHNLRLLVVLSTFFQSAWWCFRCRHLLLLLLFLHYRRLLVVLLSIFFFFINLMMFLPCEGDSIHFKLTNKNQQNVYHVHIIIIDGKAIYERLHSIYRWIFNGHLKTSRTFNIPDRTNP